MDVRTKLTVGGDKGLVLCIETLVNVEGVRLKFDGHRVASTGNHHRLWFSSTQSTIKTSNNIPVSVSPPVSQMLL